MYGMNQMEELVLEAIYRQVRRLLVADENRSDEMRRASLGALVSLKRRVEAYAESGFMFLLLFGIVRKKSHMIFLAKTKAELTETLKPSVPRWNGSSFSTGPCHVLEEEMILWSMASLEAPLNYEGASRYEEVFSIIFPEMAAEIFR